MGKIERKYLAHYINAGTAEDENYERLGQDLEELTPELAASVETKKNILGQTKTTDNGYEPTMDADPFYADPEKKLYPMIRDIALDRKKGDTCKTLMLEVIVEDTEATNHLAYVQEVIVKPQSYGGDTAGLNIPFQVSEDGKRTKGYVTATSLASGDPEFTEGTIPEDL